MNPITELRGSLSKVLKEIESTITSCNEECVEFSHKTHCRLFELFKKPRNQKEGRKPLIDACMRSERGKTDLSSLIKIIMKEKEIRWRTMYEAHKGWYEMEMRALKNSDEEALPETSAILGFISKTYSEYTRELEEYSAPLKEEDFERLYKGRLRNVNAEDDEFGLEDLELGPAREAEWVPEARTLRGDEDDPLDAKYEIQSDGVKARLFSVIQEAYFGEIAPCLVRVITREMLSHSLEEHREFVRALSDAIDSAFSESRSKPFTCAIFFLVRTAVLLAVPLLGLDHDRETVLFVNDRLRWATDRDAAQSIVYTVKSLFCTPECVGFQSLRDELCLAYAGFFAGDPAADPLDKFFAAAVGFLLTGYQTCACLTSEQVSEYWRSVVEAEGRAQTLGRSMKAFRRVSPVFPQETFPFSAAALLLRSCERTPESVYDALSLLQFSCSQGREGKLSSVVSEVANAAVDGSRETSCREYSEWIWVLGVAASSSQDSGMCAVWHRLVLDSVMRCRIVDVVIELGAVEDKFILGGDTELLPEACLGHAVLCFVRASFTDCVFDSFEFCAQKLDPRQMRRFVESVAGVRNLGGLCASRFGASFSRGFSAWGASNMGSLTPETRREMLRVLDVASGVVASRASSLSFENAVEPAIVWVRGTSKSAGGRDLVANALALLGCWAYCGGMRQEWRRLAYHELLSAYRTADTSGLFELPEIGCDEEAFRRTIGSNECALFFLALDAMATVAVEKAVNNTLEGVKKLAEAFKRTANLGGIVQKFILGYAFLRGVGAVLKLVQRGEISFCALPEIDGLFELERVHEKGALRRLELVYREYESGLCKIRALFRQQAENPSSIAFRQNTETSHGKKAPSKHGLLLGKTREQAQESPKFLPLIKSGQLKLFDVAQEGARTPGNGCEIVLHVIREPGNGIYDTYRLLTRNVYKGPVPTEHVFWCTEDTTVGELESFLHPSRGQAQYPLSVAEANKLPRRAFLFLCGWASKVQRRERACGGSVHVVFTSLELANQFPLTASTYEEDSTDDDLELIQRGMRAVVSEVVLVTGGPCTGKSECIRRAVGEKGTLVRVDGGFTERACIQSILSRERQRRASAALVFDVSNDNPPLERFQHFVYNLVAWGVVSDRGTGDVLELRKQFGRVEVYIEASTRHGEELLRFLSLLPCKVAKKVADGRMRDDGSDKDLTLAASAWEARGTRDTEEFLLACRSGVALRRRASGGFLAYLARVGGSLPSQRRYVEAASRQCRLLLARLEHGEQLDIGEALRAIDAHAREHACSLAKEERGNYNEDAICGGPTGETETACDDECIRLFQLARPEEVLSDPHMPQESVAEYFLRQEHLSIARFVRSVVGSGRKWCVLTRTSRELVFAHSNLGALESVLGGVAAVSLDDMEAFLEGVRRAEVSTILCIADLELCAAGEVRKAVEVLGSCGGRTVILVVHFPEEQAGSVFRAAALADGWEATYVDSLGLSVSAAGAIAGDDPDGTARDWIASALSVDSGNSGRVERELGHGIYAAARDMWGRIRWGRRGGSSPKDLSGVVEEGGAAFRGFAQRAVEVWRGSLIGGIIRNRKAWTGQSLLCRVNGALERFRVLSAKALLSALCDNSALETVAPPSKSAEEEKLIALALGVVELPGIESLCGDEPLPTRFAPKQAHAKPPYTPLFDTISACVERGTRAPICESTNGVLEHISCSDQLLAWYKRDLVVRGMGLGEFYVPKEAVAADSSRGVLLDACVYILESLAGPDKKNSIPSLHAALRERCEEAMSAVVLVRPLLSCLDTFPSPSTFLARDLPAHFTLQQRVFVSAVRFLWSGCKEAALSQTPTSRGSAYNATCGALGTLRSMAPHLSCLTAYSAEDALKYALMHAAALFALLEGDNALLPAFDAVSAFEVEGHPFPSLESCLSFCEAMLRNHAASGRSTERAKEFLVGVVLFFLAGDAGSQRALDDVAFLLRLYTSEDAQSIAKRHLTPETVLRLAGVWMGAGPPREWRDRAINAISPEKALGGDPAVDLLDTGREKMGAARYLYYHLCVQSLRVGVSSAGSAPDRKLQFLASAPPRECDPLAAAAHTCVLLETVAHICRDSPEALSRFPDLCAARAPNALNAAPFFLSCLGDDAAVGRVCTNRPLLEGVGMADLYTRTDVSVMCCYPPYAVGPAGPFRKLYEEVRACVAAEDARGFVEGIRRTLSVPACARGLPRQAVVGAVRMMIVTALYYEHFLEGRKRPGVREGLGELRRELDVACELEMKALTFFTRGPFVTKNEDNFDPTVTMYSSRRLGRAARGGVGGCSSTSSVVPHMMANLLAYTLGCPRDATVMYERTFRLEGVGAGFCPGSAYLRKNADCGFKMEEEAALQRAVPPIMGENTHRRLLLNTMVWGAFAWSQMLDDAGAEKAERVPGFVNKLVPNYVVNGQRRTKRANYRAYMLDRAQGFFAAAASFNGDKRWDTLQFLNEALHLHFLRAHGALGQARGRGLRARYATEEQAIEYEGEVDAIFGAVEQDYAALAEKYSRGLDNGLLRNALLRRRETSMGRFFPLDAGAKALADYAARRAPRETPYLFVDEFVRRLPKFRLLRHLPAVVRLCRELSAGRFAFLAAGDGEAESYKLTVGEAVSRYGGEAGLCEAWEAVRGVWEEIREGVRPEECHAAQEFERDLVRLDDSTPLRVLVGAGEGGEEGELFRLVRDGLAPIQDSFLVRCETAYGGLLGDGTSPAPLSLESLVDENAAAAAMAQLVGYDCERLMTELCAFVQDESGAFDGESVARYIMWTQVQGKPRIDTGRMKFKLK